MSTKAIEILESGLLTTIQDQDARAEQALPMGRLREIAVADGRQIVARDNFVWYVLFAHIIKKSLLENQIAYCCKCFEFPSKSGAPVKKADQGSH